MGFDQRTPEQYREALNRVFSRLRAGGGLSLLRLLHNESAKITLLNDPPVEGEEGGWVEFPVHLLRAEKTRALCGEFIGEDQCVWCASGIPQQRRIAITIYNETIEQVQLVHWTHFTDSPLIVLEETYNATGQPFRGMQFSIRRRGTGRETRYPMEYRGRIEDVTTLAADLRMPTREQVIGVLVAALHKTEDA